VESREYNGRWYTTIRAWKIEKNVVSASQAPASSFSAPAPSFDAAPGAGEGSDLPF